MTEALDSTSLFTAACLWEAALEALERGEKFDRDNPHSRAYSFDRLLYRRRANYGTCTIREEVVSLTAACDAAWDALTEEQQDEAGCFDWDFVPAFLRDNLFK